ncbi:glycosyl transferase family 2 [Rhizobium sp. PP-CC-2G-626]|nr:glycosyl transferase family 2 [Rhizobium sp. PP-CC-2G-626]
MRVAIGAVMKDEAPYIIEWTAFHIALGFEIIIADNGGTDDTSALLSALDRAGFITRIDLRNLQQVQLKAYRAIIRTAKSKGVDILGFMDVDEFFCRSHPIVSMMPEMGSSHLADLFRKFSATQFSFHWKNFGGGSSDLDLRKPVLERFHRHAQQTFHPNVNVKSFFLVSSVTNWPSVFTLGSYVISSHWHWAARERWFEDGRRIYRHKPEVDLVTYDHGSILHFPIKSPAEFEKKQARGDVVFKNNKYTSQYYDYYNMNDLDTPLSAQIIETLQQKISELKAAISPHYVPVAPQSLGSKLRAHVAGRGISQVGGLSRQWNLGRIAIGKLLARQGRN